MSADWLDRMALATNEPLSRSGVLRAAAATALAFGPLGSFLRSDAARAAATDCYPQCMHALSQATEMRSKHCLSQAGRALIAPVPLGPVMIVGAAGCSFAEYFWYLDELTKCESPNCGNPPNTPPPPPPTSPAAPPPPPREPEHPRDKQPKKPPKRKRRRPPAKKDPSKSSICVDLGCAAVGAKCCPTSQGSFGYVCCNCCADSGDGCKAICG